HLQVASVDLVTEVDRLLGPLATTDGNTGGLGERHGRGDERDSDEDRGEGTSHGRDRGKLLCCLEPVNRHVKLRTKWSETGAHQCAIALLGARASAQTVVPEGCHRRSASIP